MPSILVVYLVRIVAVIRDGNADGGAYQLRNVPVLLGPPSDAVAPWSGLGGRGGLMAKLLDFLLEEDCPLPRPGPS